MKHNACKSTDLALFMIQIPVKCNSKVILPSNIIGGGKAECTISNLLF